MSNLKSFVKYVLRTCIYHSQHLIPDEILGHRVIEEASVALISLAEEFPVTGSLLYYATIHSYCNSEDN